VSEDNEPVPKLPRSRGIRLAGPEMFRIALTCGLLVAVLVLAKPCGNAMGNFVMGFEGSGKGSQLAKPGTVDLPGSPAPTMGNLPGSADDYIQLHAGMTDEQVKEAIDQARAKHKGSAAAGSAANSKP
jgi:hypothetical protein